MRVTEKGQVTIPKNIRSNLGIEAGSEVEFELRDGEAVLRVVEAPLDAGQREARELLQHLRRHQGSMSLGELSGEEFYRLLRD